MKSILGYLFICLILLVSSNALIAQEFEVDGKAKIVDLTLDNSASTVVVVLADGTLGTRNVSTIGGSGSGPFIVGGGSANNGFDNGTNNFIPMASSTVRGEISGNADSRVPMNGTISAFEGAINGSTSEADYTFTVYKNGAATALTCTINQGVSSCTNLVNSIQFCEGDRISVLYTGNETDNTASDNRFGRWIGIFTPGGTCP